MKCTDDTVEKHARPTFAFFVVVRLTEHRYTDGYVFLRRDRKSRFRIFSLNKNTWIFFPINVNIDTFLFQLDFLTIAIFL